LWRSEGLEGASAGFTLIEALAALGVMAAGLAAVGALASSNFRASLRAERHLAEIETGRMIMTGLPARAALPFGRLTGTLEGYEWRIDSAPVGTAAANGANVWTPQGIALLVRSPSGATIEIDTIRLRRQAAP
jgi:general secretion pathway protein I